MGKVDGRRGYRLGGWHFFRKRGNQFEKGGLDPSEHYGMEFVTPDWCIKPTFTQ